MKPVTDVSTLTRAITGNERLSALLSQTVILPNLGHFAHHKRTLNTKSNEQKITTILQKDNSLPIKQYIFFLAAYKENLK